MFQFSTTCVDNFFKHPDEIVYLAETLDYKPHSEGLWPGARSPELHHVNPALKTAICTKYLKLHLSSAPMIGYQCVAYFQKIGAASGGLGKGWVHNDTPHLHTTIIYLNKHENLKSGTSLYRPKRGIGPMYTTRHNMKKREFNLGKLSAKEAEKYRTESNADFEETVRFSNIYNRCIGFDAMEWHAANEFVQNIKEPRLTLIIFWNEISSGQTGLQRSEMEIL